MKRIENYLILLFLLKAYINVSTLGWEYQTKPVWTDLDQSDTNIEIIGNEIVQLRTYKRISHDFEKFNEKHKACFEKIDDKNFNEENITKCVGRNFNYVHNDLDYEVKKLLARVEKRIKGIMLEKCYKVGAGDIREINFCDLLEGDLIEMMWEGLNFYDIMDHHKSKYLYIYAEIPETVYEQIRLEIKTVHNNFSEILDEVLDHRRILIYKFKRYIDNRTKLILHRKAETIEDKPSTHFKSKITIDETVNDPNSIYIGNLPNQILMNTSQHTFSDRPNIYKESLLKDHPNYIADQENSFKGEGPIINFPGV